MGEYFDISPPLDGNTAVFPGDQKFEHRKVMSFEGGHHLELSYIKTTVHIGAHADAPSHYARSGQAIHERSLLTYLGLCQVIDVQVQGGTRIQVADLKVKIEAPRILFRTLTFKDPQKWNSDFASLSPELIEHLYRAKVQLVGIDTPSIDPWDSKALESHQMVNSKDMAILEGLILDKVPPGLYNLVALPLRLTGVEASPVRAILLPLKGSIFS